MKFYKIPVCRPKNKQYECLGLDNMFCADEKAGLFVGHTEAMSTGALAGHNAVRSYLGMPLLILPSTIAIGVKKEEEIDIHLWSRAF